MNKKILLLNPVTRAHQSILRAERCQQKILPGMALWPPLSLASIAAVLKPLPSLEIRLTDAEIEKLSFESMVRGVREYSPDLVVIQGTTPTIYDDIEIVRQAGEGKEGMLFAVFGSHATVRPGDYLKEGFHFAVLGEPEMSVEGLVRAILEGREKETALLKQIPGLAFRNEEGILYKSPQMNTIQDLDSLPFPAREYIRNNEYIMPGINEPFTLIKTSRGCPYLCVYCTSRLYYGSRWRSRSPENIFAEIRHVTEKYGIRTFLLHSDTFNFREEQVVRLCDLIIGSGLKIKWLANSRTNHFTERMAEKMKKAGCWTVSFGIESGSEQVLKNIKKGATLDDAFRAVAACRKCGIQSIGYFMLGLPGETEDTIRETIAFMKKLDPDYIQFYIATPFPGTEFFDMAVKNGWIKELKWDHLYNGLTDILEYPGLSNKKLLYYQKKAYREFYFRPRRILKEIGRIRSLRDIGNYIRTFFNFLRVFFQK